jgi:hypothetical protein
VPAGEARAAIHQMSVRRHAWELGAYCAAFCGFVAQHHGLEDRAVFPHLRRAEPGLAPVLDRLEEEHVAIAGMLDAIDRVLVVAAREGADAEALRAAVDPLAEALLSHLRYEEQQIVGPLSRHGFYSGQI